MSEPIVFPLRPFPRRLARSLLGFAAAGSFFAFVVWSDGTGGKGLPGAILLAAWGIPALFAWQVLRTGFDPLVRLVATEQGLEAYNRGGGCRFFAWKAMRQLVSIEGFRHRSWAIITEDSSLRWFGELEDPDGFARLVSERAGLEWESHTKLPPRPTPPEA
jgi:hypothetical protein